MPATDKQIEANRRDYRKSTGPKSAEGKERVRRDALRHGLTGQGVSEDMRTEVVAELAMFDKGIKSTDPVEQRLAERAAPASVRLNRMHAHQKTLIAERRRHAERAWDRAREAEAAAWAAKLDTQPAEAVKQLERTTEGRGWLLDQWDEPAHTYQGGGWSIDDVQQVVRLLGAATWTADEPRRREMLRTLDGRRPIEPAGASRGSPPARRASAQAAPPSSAEHGLGARTSPRKARTVRDPDARRRETKPIRAGAKQSQFAPARNKANFVASRCAR